MTGELKRIGICPGCDQAAELIETPAMTCYEWDGEGEDPNASFFACKDCSEEYIENMQDLWDDYYRGR